MTTAVANAAGGSSALAEGRSGYRVYWAQVRYPHEAVSGYQVYWAQVRYPHEAGYEVYWAQIRLPYVVTNIVLLPGGHGVSPAARSKRPIVDDRNDLQDLCDVWELMMRRAA